MKGPLNGIRVLDIAHYGVGPWAASLLGMMGAEVIKIEPPEGDYLSRNPPPYKDGFSTSYMACNVSKKCIILDLRDERVRQAVFELVKTCDILVENHRPGFLERRGLGYEAVSKLNPRIIYCSSSGYGSRGPYKDMGSADPYGAAFSGFASVSGPVGGPPEGMKGGSHIDLNASSYIVSGILAALYYRELTGKGQKVETSQMQTAMALVAPRAQEYFVSGKNPTPMGSGVSNIVPSRAFKAGDGKYINVSAQDQPTWKCLCQALGLSQLAEDPKFKTNALRVEHRDELDKLLEGVIAQKSANEWLAILEGAKVPCGLNFNYNQVRMYPQVRQLKMLELVETPWGEIRVGGLPWRFNKTPGEVRPTRKPGQDTEEVLESLGYGQLAKERSSPKKQ